MRQRVVYFAMILAAVTSVSAQEAKKLDAGRLH